MSGENSANFMTPGECDAALGTAVTRTVPGAAEASAPPARP